MFPLTRDNILKFYPDNGSQNIAFPGKKPSASKFLYTAHKIIKNEKNAKDRKRLYKIVETEFNLKSHSKNCIVLTIQALINFLKGWGFNSEVRLYKRIRQMYTNEMFSQSESVSPHLPSQKKSQIGKNNNSNGSSLAIASSGQIALLQQNPPDFQCELKDMASLISNEIIKKASENKLPHFIGLGDVQEDEEKAKIVFETLNEYQLLGLLDGLFKGNHSNPSIFLSCLVGINTTKAIQPTLSFRLSSLIYKEKLLAEYSRQNPFFLTTNSPKKELAIRSFFEDYIHFALQNRSSYEKILNDLWDQCPSAFENFNLQSQYTCFHPFFRYWANKNGHLDLLENINSPHFSDVRIEEAMSMFEQRRCKRKKLKKLFTDLQSSNPRAMGNFVRNFQEVQKLFLPKELKKWAKKDLFKLDKQFFEDKARLLFSGLNYDQASALIEGYAKRSLSYKKFSNLMIGCFFVDRKQESKAVMKLYKKMIQTFSSKVISEYLDQFESDSNLMLKFGICHTKFLIAIS